jgi:MraZ protein
MEKKTSASAGLSTGPSLYVGEFEHSVDDKHRLTIPSKWRFAGDLTAVYLALPSPTGCIAVYPPAMVERLQDRVASLSLGDLEGQRALALLFGKADTCSYDKQGRMVLSDKLCQHAQIGRSVVLVGSFSTFSIWEPARYQKYLQQAHLAEDETSRILKRLGL